MRRNILCMLVAGLGILVSSPALADVDCQQPGLLNIDGEAIRTCAEENGAWAGIKLQHAQSILERILSKSPDSYDARDQSVRDILKEYLDLEPADYRRWLPVLINDVDRLRKLPAVRYLIPGDPDFADACDGTTNAYARTSKQVPNTIFICSSWLLQKLSCRRQTLLHERLHLIGHVDLIQLTKDRRNPGVAKLIKDAGVVGLVVAYITKEKRPPNPLTSDYCSDKNFEEFAPLRR